jgi:hypothetical protein
VEPGGQRELRVGFVVDVVGYGGRPPLVQELVQQRLARLVRAVLAEAGLELALLDHQWTGDGVIVLLPRDGDPTSVLPVLLSAAADRLAADNREHDDRIRVRMAVGAGIAAPGAAGFAGPMVLDINRLVDGPVLRETMTASPEADLAVLLSDQLHGYVVQPGYPGPAPLRPVRVVFKEFDQRAWLWTP